MVVFWEKETICLLLLTKLSYRVERGCCAILFSCTFFFSSFFFKSTFRVMTDLGILLRKSSRLACAPYFSMSPLSLPLWLAATFGYYPPESIRIHKPSSARSFLRSHPSLSLPLICTSVVFIKKKPSVVALPIFLFASTPPCSHFLSAWRRCHMTPLLSQFSKAGFIRFSSPT